MQVNRASLTDLHPLAQGAFGRVFRIDGYTIPGDPSRLAYKEFFPEHRGSQARAAEAAVAMREGLSSADQHDLDGYAAWPRAVVLDGRGAVCGLLMPLLPESFFCQLLDPETGSRKSTPRELQWIISTKAQRDAAGVDVGDIERTDRLVLLAQVVYVIALLHKRGWVYGDLSLRNVAISLDPLKAVVLDCDAAAAQSDGGRAQGNTPGWIPPECGTAASRRQRLQDDVTDVYKLGLAILRCLTPGRGASTTTSLDRLAGELDDEGEALIARALSHERHERPKASELYCYLETLAQKRMAPPLLEHVTLSTTICLRGQDVRVNWDVQGADHVRVFIDDRPVVDVAPSQSLHGHTFPATSGGRVKVEASNRYATVIADVGALQVYELPDFAVRLDYLPRPRIPQLLAFTPPAMTTVARGHATLAISSEDRPRLPDARLTELLAALTPANRRPVSWPRLEEAVFQSYRDFEARLIDLNRRKASPRAQS